jgi:hypothetical protein
MYCRKIANRSKNSFRGKYMKNVIVNYIRNGKKYYRTSERCPTQKPSPYLKKYLPSITRGLIYPDLDTTEILACAPLTVMIQASQLFRYKAVDLAGGNGRNTLCLQQQGLWRTTLLGRAGGNGVLWNFEAQKHAPLPFKDAYADIILMQYMMMRLSKEAQKLLLEEVNRIAKPGAFAVCEIRWFPNDSACFVATRQDAVDLTLFVVKTLGWDMVHQSKYRFIARKPSQV